MFLMQSRMIKVSIKECQIKNKNKKQHDAYVSYFPPISGNVITVYLNPFLSGSVLQKIYL